MKKYKVVYAQAGGWCVILTEESVESKFYGFRDEAHAQDWAAQKLKNKQFTGAKSKSALL